MEEFERQINPNDRRFISEASDFGDPNAYRTPQVITDVLVQLGFATKRINDPEVMEGMRQWWLINTQLEPVSPGMAKSFLHFNIITEEEARLIPGYTE